MTGPAVKTAKLARFEAFSSFIKTFGNARRLMILSSISSGEKTVSQIAEDVGLIPQIVSQNLSVMADKGAVTSRKEGRNSWYRCASPKFCQGITLIREGLEDVVAEKKETLSY